MDKPTFIEVLEEMQGVYGEDLLSLLMATEVKTLRKLKKGTLPTELQVSQLEMITRVHELLSYLPKEEEKLWFVTFDDFYLYGYPLQEMRIRPNDVRIAALCKRGQNAV